MKIDILTLFPEIFDFYFKNSIIKKAQEKKILEIKAHNLRDFTNDPHRQVDDKPFGGGRGMVLKIEPIFKALSSLTKLKIHNSKLKVAEKNTKVILFTPRGKNFNQRTATRFSKLKHLILICGRYEGVDERISKIVDEEISIGEYVLMGGELPALVFVETVARLVPGVVGKFDLLKQRITKKGGFAEYPQYTRPAVFSVEIGKNKIEWKVPRVLLSGDHKKIEEWRKKHNKIIE